MKELNQYIDHTFLNPLAKPEDIVRLCDEAKKYNFYAVCVNSSYVYLAAKELKDSPVKVAATVGFPLGASSTQAKVTEAKRAVKDGADEIDMVINLGWLRSELTKSVREEITAVKKAIGRRVLKVIIETCYLSNHEKKLACEIVKKAGADFIKTSTGFGDDGAEINDVLLIKACAGDTTQVKASGGIKTEEQACAFIRAGADRLGTSSGVQIVLSSKEKAL
ncbi:deoxyribose-phosphate aldolase [Aureisphaera galaxeae]|uniref:deoxyribose-phosphate aldolase n=1 Tax=Aureisphaera galaxeae TaxID=1538023 RepID=UPI002350D3AB|nr:deoxyribose-phosphate aldolase [Aureisphaera galaxeae]MDC8003767.1 deoxyribose-phosphate aldolase [Aureisphaera galaxeae]